MEEYHRDRLLNVAKALDEEAAWRAANPPRGPEDRFRMIQFVNPCGSPACALGTYAARKDLQSEFVIGPSAYGSGLWVLDSSGESVCVDELDDEFRDEDGDYIGTACGSIKDHFGVTDEEGAELFCAAGCGNAQTEHEAAAYIRAFVKRKEREARK